MYKRALMLTAATLALMGSHAMAAGPTTIDDKQTTQQKTSVTGDLTIASSGSVTLKDGSAAVLVDSGTAVTPISVTVADGGLISNKDTDSAIGVRLNADGYFGSLSSGGAIDLTGSGTQKTGILLTPSGATGNFTGDLTLSPTSTVKVSGNEAFGLRIIKGATLTGNINLSGVISAANDTTGSDVATNATGVSIEGNVTGDIINAGSLGAVGTGARGMVIFGSVGGSLQNSSTIGATGISAALANGNPVAGSALIIGNSINGGFFNSGPINAGDSIATGSIASSGTNPAINISSSASGVDTPITIGSYTDSGVTASILNRGSFRSAPLDANKSSATVQIAGSSSSLVSLPGGIYNSGTISSSSKNDQTGAGATNAITLNLSQYAEVAGGLRNVGGAGPGTISANLSGSLGGSATAIFVGQTSTLPSLTNSGTITAAASTTDTSVATLSATAISDASGTLVTINNSGTISATTSTLDNDAQLATAVYLGNAQSGVNFTNTGKVAGNVTFGIYDDTLTLSGTPDAAANVLGDIAFGGGTDTLSIGTNSAVIGGITENNGGTLNIDVSNGGILTLTNKTAGLEVGSLTVGNGSSLGLTLSDAFNKKNHPAADALIYGNSIKVDPNADFSLNYGGFLSAVSGAPASFTLFEASTLDINLDKLRAQIGNVPFLFQDCGTGACLTQTASSGLNQLVLSLTPKTTTELGLTGNAVTMFPFVNEALANDNELGAALVAGVTTKEEAQAAYLAFTPDVTGANRATVISLTDQATGPVAARQRILRMYAAQPGELTLWGQEFAQRLNQGNNTSEGAFRGTGFGFVLGMDAGTPQAGRYGAAFTFFSGDSNEKQPRTTKSTSEWYMLTGYTDWRGKGFFLDSQASVAYGNIKSRRFIKFPTLSRTASSTHTSLAGALGVTTGAVFTFGSTSFVPQISIDGMTMREDGYTETGGGAGVNLKVQPVYAHSARGFIGTAIRQDIDLGGYFIQPEGRIGYRYDFLNGGAKIKGEYLSTGSAFEIKGPDPEKGNLVAGGSLSVTTGAWSIGLNYDYIRGTHGDVNQVGTISLLGRI